MKLVHANHLLCILSWYCVTLEGMDQSQKQKKDFSPRTYMQRVIVNSLEKNDSDYLYNHILEGTISYEHQKLFPYPVVFADSNINSQEATYTAYTHKQQAEYIEMFSYVVDKMETLKKADAPLEEIQNCVTLSYQKLTPLLWRVHVLWLLRQKSKELFGEVILSLMKCVPCRYYALDATCSLFLAVWYYTTIISTKAWSENRHFEGEQYIVPCVLAVNILRDLVFTPLNQYSQAKTFINEKFKKYQMWKKIADDLARQMEQTYKPR